MSSYIYFQTFLEKNMKSDSSGGGRTLSNRLF